MELIKRVSFCRQFLASHDVAPLLCHTPSVLEVRMVFHTIVIVENAIQEINLKCSSVWRAGTLLDYTVLKISKALTALAEAADLATLAKLVSPYI